MEKDQEIKEEEMEQFEPQKKDAKKKRSAFRVVVSVVTWVLVLIIALSAALGFINIGRVNDGEEPYLVLKEENYQENESKIKVYHFGLYKIVKEEKATQTSISLKPFFLKNTK